MSFRESHSTGAAPTRAASTGAASTGGAAAASGPASGPRAGDHGDPALPDQGSVPSGTSPAARQSGWLEDPVTRGTLLGVISAMAYTAANLELRQVARPGEMDWAIWVSAWKAVPATALAVGLIFWRHARGLSAWTPRRLVLPLIGTGLVMQLAGNAAFQWALSLGGLALTVPLIFATLIAVGAWLGRMLLGEAVSRRSAVAMAILLLAIGVLSSGAGDATSAVASSGVRVKGSTSEPVGAKSSVSFCASRRLKCAA